MSRGHYRILLGMAAGVGKTYRMLQEGQQALAEGRDVVIGYLEPHDRPETAALVEGILANRPHPEQGYRACLGLTSLGTKFTPERLEAACKRAVCIKSYSYKSVQSILKAGLDKQPMPQHKEVTPIEHENIRGDRYYS